MDKNKDENMVVWCEVKQKESARRRRRKGWITESGELVAS